MAFDPDGDLEIPAVVIGRRCDETALQRVDDAPWLAAFVHQCGGYSCMQEPLAGIVLPLAWNASNAEPAARVLQGLDALSADSPAAARRERLPGDIAGLHLTAGAPYDRGQLDALDAFVAQAFRLPRATGGVEALVELSECDPVSFFDGWRVLSTHATRDVLGDQRTGDWHADLSRARALWDAETVLDRALLDALATRLGDASIDPSLRAYLVWVNSD